MSDYLARAQLLITQERFELAIEQIERVLAADPDNGLAFGLLAYAQLRLERLDQATASIHQAMNLAPELSHNYFFYSLILQERNRLKEAFELIREAIRMDPESPDYYLQLATLHVASAQWKDALAAAEEGLHVDPAHTSCLNVKSFAQVKLGLKSEAADALESSMQRNPEDPNTHAMKGWAELQAGNAKQAQVHFRESLRLDPNNEFARDGLVHGLNARSPIYRIYLKYLMAMQTLGSKGWFVIVGLFVAYQLLRAAARNNPALAVWIAPLIAVYIAFVVLTWTATPVGNLILLLDPFGRLVLKPAEKRTAIAVGSLLACSVACLITWLGRALLFPDSPTVYWKLAAYIFATMVVPIGSIINCSPGWPRTVAIVVTSIMGFLGSVFLTTWLPGLENLGGELVSAGMAAAGGLALFGYIVITFLVFFLTNWLVRQTPKK